MCMLASVHQKRIFFQEQIHMEDNTNSSNNMQQQQQQQQQQHHHLQYCTGWKLFVPCTCSAIQVGPLPSKTKYKCCRLENRTADTLMTKVSAHNCGSRGGKCSIKNENLYEVYLDYDKMSREIYTHRECCGSQENINVSLPSRPPQSNYMSE